MKKILLLSFFGLQFSFAFAQYVLQLTNLKSGEVICFKEGAFLCYQPSCDENVLYGRLK